MVRHHRLGGSSTFDKHNCYGTFTERGTWKAIRDTRTYRNVSGAGTYKVTAKFIGCNQHRPPHPFELQIKAVGHLTIRPHRQPAAHRT